MAKRIVMIFITLVAVTAVLPLNAFAEADGFRGIKWGIDISSLKDMKYVRTDPSYGGIKIYLRKNDDLKIGGAKLESIEYSF